MTILDERSAAVSADGLSKCILPALARRYEDPVPILARARRRRAAAEAEAGGAPDLAAEDAVDDPVVDDDDDEDDGGEVDDVGPVSTAVVWPLRDVSFSLPAGSGLALLGPPNAGKTTLLRVLGGVIPPSSGSATLHGRAFPPPGFVRLFGDPKRSATFNVLRYVRAAGFPVGAARHRAREIEAFAGVPQDAPVGKATRTLAVATALHLDADILLVDSPALSGDAAVQQRTVDAIAALLERGGNVIVETADLRLIDRLCEYALWLEDGRVAGFGAAYDVLNELAAAADHRRPAFERRAHEAAPGRVSSFNESAAILGAGVDDEVEGALTVRIRLETARPAVPVRCGLALTDGLRKVWLEQRAPALLQSSGRHDVVVRVPQASLPGGHYHGHVEAIVSESVLIAREQLFEVDVHSAGTSAEPGPDGWIAASGEWQTTPVAVSG